MAWCMMVFVSSRSWGRRGITSASEGQAQAKDLSFTPQMDSPVYTKLKSIKKHDFGNFGAHLKKRDICHRLRGDYQKGGGRDQFGAGAHLLNAEDLVGLLGALVLRQGFGEPLADDC